MLTIILFNMDDHFYDLFYNVHKAVESGVRPRAVCTAHEELDIQLSVPCLLYLPCHVNLPQHYIFDSTSPYSRLACIAICNLTIHILIFLIVCTSTR